MSKTQTEQLDDIFLMLSHDIRRGILFMVAKKPRTISEIASPFKVSLPAISKHIAYLEDAGFVAKKKQGRYHIVSLNAAAFKKADRWLERFLRNLRTQ